MHHVIKSTSIDADLTAFFISFLFKARKPACQAAHFPKQGLEIDGL